jgi:hypothetical protein
VSHVAVDVSCLHSWNAFLFFFLARRCLLPRTRDRPPQFRRRGGN